MKIRVDSQNDSILYVVDRADRLGYLISASLLLGSLILLFVGLTTDSYSSNGVLVFFVCAGLGTYGVLFVRDRSFILNKATGKISYEEGGILGSNSNRQEAEYSLQDVRAVEMKRHVRRWGDQFQIRLALGSENYVNLSSANLSFSACQDYATQIQQFLGADVPLKAVD